MQKWIDLGQGVLGLLVALWVLCGLAANFLPDGKAKLACSYAGMRLGKAIAVLRGALPADSQKQPPSSTEAGKS